MATINRLSDEVLLKILNQSDYHSLHNLKRVSKRFNMIVRDKSLDVKLFRGGEVIPSSPLHVLANEECKLLHDHSKETDEEAETSDESSTHGTFGNDCKTTHDQGSHDIENEYNAEDIARERRQAAIEYIKKRKEFLDYDVEKVRLHPVWDTIHCLVDDIEECLVKWRIKYIKKSGEPGTRPASTHILDLPVVNEYATSPPMATIYFKLNNFPSLLVHSCKGVTVLDILQKMCALLKHDSNVIDEEHMATLPPARIDAIMNGVGWQSKPPVYTFLDLVQMVDGVKFRGWDQKAKHTCDGSMVLYAYLDK